jgi:glycine/sarcosine N-methyltransferase
MAFYRSIAPWYDFIFPTQPEQANFVAKHCDGLQNKHLLDVGCGTGNLTLQLIDEGAAVVGIDLDDQMLALAREKSAGVANVKFKNINMLKLADYFDNESLDVITCFGNTLVHLQSPGEMYSFFTQCKKLLKPHGVLFIQIINYDYILDNGIGGLPKIENENIDFERIYEFREQDELINFKTRLTVKTTNEVIANSVPLFPLRVDLLNVLLTDAGFDEQYYFGGFDNSELMTNSVPVIVVARM